MVYLLLHGKQRKNLITGRQVKDRVYIREIRDARAPLVELPSDRLHWPSQSPSPSFTSLSTVRQEQTSNRLFRRKYFRRFRSYLVVSFRWYHSYHADACCYW